MIYSTTEYTKRILFISFIALIFALSYMLGTLSFVVILPLVVIILFNSFIRNDDHFGLLMSLYFCSHFPYMKPTGGYFNYVAFILVSMIFLFKIQNFKSYFKMKLPLLPMCFIIIIIMSTILGWIFNFKGTMSELVLSILSFFGTISLFLFASNIKWSDRSFKIFFNLNFFITLYSFFVSLNMYLRIIPFNLPLFHQYAAEWKDDFVSLGRLEAGGIIGSSPLYGEHSMVMAMFFIVLLFAKNIRNRFDISFNKTLFGLLISYINIFFSISRSIFLLSILGLALVWLGSFLLRLESIKFKGSYLIILALAFYALVHITGIFRLDFVFTRLEDVEYKNIDFETIQTGQSINRSTAFLLAQQRQRSRNWLIGYGYGLYENNRNAWYVDPRIKRGSAHSQYYAVLFIFGWLGAIAYFAIFLYLLIGLISSSIRKKWPSDYLEVLAIFFTVSSILFLASEYTKDAISVPSYFTVTMIWAGLGYSILKRQSKDFQIKNTDQNVKK